MIATSLFFYSCDEDSNDLTYTFTGNSATYDLGFKDVDGISGNAIFTENIDGSTTINLDLSGTPTGGFHPAHIHFNTAVEGGGIAVSLEVVNGSTGTSITRVTALNDGTPITFDELANFDGYINVHLSANELGTIVAQGDIGQNDLTGMTKTYDLGEKDVAGISGNVIFSERVNGEALAEIMISGTPAGGMHPAHIHANTAVETGRILYSFTPVNGDTGMSVKNLSVFDDGSAFGYADIEELDGYVNVHLSSDAIGTIVSQGYIGQNDLTGDSKVYTLAEKDVPSISGTATFFKRVNGTALSILDIQNTLPGGMHLAHIHENDAVAGGPIAFTFNPVNGDTGLSQTQVEKLNDDSDITYDEILTFDGYINVHLSATQLGTIVAQGNIGSNE